MPDGVLHDLEERGDTVIDELREWVDGLVRSPARPPTWLRFPTASAEQARLVPSVDYFKVRVHRIHLAYEREWFEKYSPLLTIATEFSYDGKLVTLPSVIGPSTIEHLGRAAPATFTVAGTTICGPYPIREPRLTVTAALHRVARTDLATGFLDAVEGASKALDLVSGLAPYTALARVVANGVTALTGGDRPLLARRDEFNPAVTSYYALVAPDAGVDPATLMVQGGELQQPVGGALQPFRAADYVLYSVERAGPDEIDITRLPLHQQWLLVLKDANAAKTSEIWEDAKTNLSALITSAFASPDLTYAHAAALEQDWKAKAKERHLRAQELGDLGGGGAVDKAVVDRDADIRTRARSVLDL